jgi:CDP-glycerol glycerophosphotransferase (TagB/SpsB family)
MRISDLLISDISSTIFEYLPLNRPIIMAECLSIRLKHRIFKKRFSRKLDIERYDSIDFVHRMNDSGQLNGLVYHCIEYPDELSELRTEAIETYLYKNDGKASSRLLDEIENKLSQV